MNISSIGLLALTLLLSPTLFAGTAARYIWSDSKGFIAADANCLVKQDDHGVFFIAQKPHSQLNASSKLKGLGFFGGWNPGNLLDRSLVTAKEAPKPTDGSAVHVVSIPKNAFRPNTMNFSKAGDDGYLAKESLQDIGNFVIEVITSPTTLNPAPFKIQNSFWQATMNNEKLTALICEERNGPVRYVLFDVYDSTSIDPIAHVGVNILETKILSAINVYTPDEANQVVSGEEPPATKPPIASAPGTRATPTTIKNPDDTANTPISEGDLEYVLCTEDKLTPVLEKDLTTTAFTANPFETVIPNQSWDEKQKTTHLEVQFPNRSEAPKSGWILRGIVQLRSECAPLKKNQPSEEDSVVDDSLQSLDNKVSRNDCCKFPTIKRSTESYAGGTLQFRARRNKGRRLHAGCDLYRKKGEAAVAVASGTIIRGMYYFYQGVFALEIKHPKFIARYGEVLGNLPKGIAKGKNVVAGQTVGYIGKVTSGCCTPMLHFELYKGTSHGSLTRYRLPPYDRRSDVLNPTTYLRQWEKSQFGKSY